MTMEFGIVYLVEENGKNKVVESVKKDFDSFELAQNFAKEVAKEKGYLDYRAFPLDTFKVSELVEKGLTTIDIGYETKDYFETKE